MELLPVAQWSLERDSWLAQFVAKAALPHLALGYFEILSEDGKPVKCLESVLELHRSFPEMCLVRSPTKAYLPDGDGELRSLYRTRTLQEAVCVRQSVQEGEVLTLVGQFNFRKVLFLRCFDSEGGSVYLKLGAKGRFSPVARSDSLSGVHTLSSLLSKRLPLTVKLLSPNLPSELEKLAGSSVAFHLQAVFSEEVVFGQALSRQHSPFLAVPLNAHLKLAPARNHSSVRGSSEFQKLCAGAEEALSSFLERITPFNEHAVESIQLQSQVEEEPPMDPDGVFDYEHYGTSSSGHPSDPPAVSDQEIDQLYDYIRGLAPLPDSCHESRDSLLGGGPRSRPPPPPPLETIPSSRKSASNSSRSKSPAQHLLDSANRLRRLSKSTEKMGLAHIQAEAQPVYQHPPPKRPTPVRRHSEKKRRPLSMADAGSAPFHHHQPTFHAPPFFPPPGPAPLYRSLANLALPDHPPFYPPPPSAQPHRHHHFAPVFPRFAPRYAFAPPPPYRLS